MERRGLLAAAGTVLSLLGGCLANGPGRSGQSGPADTSPGNAPSTGRPEDASGDERPSMMDARGPTRGESDVEMEIEEVEADEEVEYVEEDDTVRYVAGWRHTNHEEVEDGEPPEREPFYETTPFERWGATQCLSAAARAAAEHANDELGVDEVGGGITSLVEGEDRAAFVSVETVLDRDGAPVHEASVEFDALVAATPATVAVTYHLDDREYRMDAPVYARYDVLQQE